MKTENVVMHKDFRQPITEEQYEVAEASHEVATFLVRSAQVVDLEKIAEGVRRAVPSM